MAPLVKRTLFFLLLLYAWEGLYQLAFWHDYQLPSPFQVFDALFEGIARGGYLRGVAVSLTRMAAGYALSIVAGVLLGILLAASRTLEETLGTLIVALQTLPSICWLPFAIIWFELSEKAILFVVVMGSVLSVTMATTGGIKRVPPLLVSAARTMGARGLRLHFHVTLPAALPSVVEGIKQGWSFAWRALMAAELIFMMKGRAGLGHHLHMGRELNDMSGVMAVILVIMVIGIVVDRLLFETIERSIRRRWGIQSP